MFYLCRLWDVRNLKESFKILKGRIGAIRSLRFSGDGRHLVMAEPADFVHVFETGKDYSRSQEIDLFGEVRTGSGSRNRDLASWSWAAHGTALLERRFPSCEK